MDEGSLYATGSRTAAYVGVADTISEAEQIAEQEISCIKGPLFHREDIGTSALINKRIEAMRSCDHYDSIRNIGFDSRNEYAYAY